MPKRPVVLLHGYSASARSLEVWRQLLPAPKPPIGPNALLRFI